MKKYKIWQAPVFAFFSTHFYRYIGTQAKGLGFVYLLAILAITCIIPQIRTYMDARTMLARHGSELIAQVPNIKIENGKLHIDRESPCFVVEPETGTCLIAFDTSGKNLVAANEGIGCIVTEDGIHQYGMTTSFKGIDNFHLSQREFMHWLTVGAYVMPAVTYLILVPASWLLWILGALLFSLPGLLMARTLGVNIKYLGILRIACFALGNVLIVDAIVNITQVTIPSWILYKLVIALGYTLFGVGANLSQPGFQSVSDEPARETER